MNFFSSLCLFRFVFLSFFYLNLINNFLFSFLLVVSAFMCGRWSYIKVVECAEFRQYFMITSLWYYEILRNTHSYGFSLSLLIIWFVACARRKETEIHFFFLGFIFRFSIFSIVSLLTQWPPDQKPVIVSFAYRWWCDGRKNNDSLLAQCYRRRKLIFSFSQCTNCWVWANSDRSTKC